MRKTNMWNAKGKQLSKYIGNWTVSFLKFNENLCRKWRNGSIIFFPNLFFYLCLYSNRNWNKCVESNNNNCIDADECRTYDGLCLMYYNLQENYEEIVRYIYYYICIIFNANSLALCMANWFYFNFTWTKCTLWHRRQNC